MNVLQRKMDRVGKWSLPVFIILTLISTYIVTIPLALIEPLLSNTENVSITASRVNVLEVFIACIYGPIIETIVFQCLPVLVMNEGLKIKSKGIQTLVSALLFGLLHVQSFYYFLVAFLIGIALAGGFVVYKQQHGYIKACIAITIVHALRNGVALLSTQL